MVGWEWEGSVREGGAVMEVRKMVRSPRGRDSLLLVEVVTGLDSRLSAFPCTYAMSSSVTGLSVKARNSYNTKERDIHHWTSI